jgi:hypothetical protein
MVPIHQGPGWGDILRKKNEYSAARFDNELLAIFSESGDRPLTRDELIACCDPKIDPYNEEFLARVRSQAHGETNPVYAGVDWGHGDSSQGKTGYTVLSLGSYLGGPDFKIFWIKRFEGAESEPLRQLDMIIEILRAFNVKLVGADFGAGFVSNAQIAEAIAPRGGVVVKFHYSANPKVKMRYNPDNTSYTLHRSQVMGNMFNVMKTARKTGKRSIHLPKWEVFERPFGYDILSIFSEYSDSLRMLKYDHPLDRPDDSFHSILYCMLASTLRHPRKDLFGLVDVSYQGEAL